MKKLILSMIAVAMTVFGLGAVAATSPAYAAVVCPDGKTADTYAACTAANSGGTAKVDENSATKDVSVWGTVNTIMNVICGVLGTVAVFLVVMGGLQFMTSQGDTAKTTKARNTILYGVIGLVIVMLAFAIVNFVLSNVFGGTTTTTGVTPTT